MSKKAQSLTTRWLVIYGLINLFASGRWSVAAAAWFAPIFALRYLHVNPQRRRYLYFYLVSWITVALPWYGATPMFGPAHFIFMAVNTLLGSIPFVLDAWLAPKLRRGDRLPFGATFIFPLSVTALEFVSGSANPLGNFGAVGYSQYGLPVVTQMTAVTGMLGLTFLVSWFPAIVNWAWDNDFDWRRIRTGVAAFALLVVLVFGYGIVRLATAPAAETQETVTIASFTVAENHVGELNEQLADEGLAAYRRETQAVHADYMAMTELAIADGAKIILWPEMAIIGIEEDVQSVVERGQTLAGQAGIYLAMPTFTAFPNSDRTWENVLYVAGPDGSIALEHVKYGGNVLEGTLKGTGNIATIDTEYGHLAGIICWDTNYPNIVRQIGVQQTDILLSPAKEWAGINPMHAEMAVFRALENGSAVVRQADEGLSIVVDGYGRILASGEGLAHNGNYLLVDVPVTGPQTLYPVIGDVVGIFSLIGLVFILGFIFVSRKRRRQTDVRQPVVTS